jgi:MarR-like DNA-binding transcriptional regulator SgrR of sgrS sRNA
MENVQHGFVLENLRTKKNSDSHFELLKTRFLSKLKINLFEDLWRTSTFIVPRNELCYAINHHILKMNSKKLKLKSYTIIATDSYFKILIHSDIQYIIKQIMPISKTQNLTPFLKIANENDNSK